MALGPDFRPAEESNTGGFRPLLLAPPHFNPTPTSIWAKVRGEELSSTIDSGGESASFYEALTGARELQQLVAAGWIGVTFAAGPGVLSNLCRATATTALQLATNRPATAKPTIRTFQRTTLQRCAILLQNRLLGFFATKSTPRPAGTNPAVRGGERG